MSMFPGDISSRIRAYESGLGPNPFQRMPQVPDVMPMQPPGGIAGLFERLRRPQFPPMGGFGGFGGGRFGPPPFDPRMRGGFPGMGGGFPPGGGGFFGGFRPRLKRRRRPRPQMPDYSKQFSTLEAKIAELQKQLADRQAASPMPDPVMDVAGPRPPMQVGTLGGPGYGEFPLGTAGPRIDPSDPRFVPPPTGGFGGNIDLPNIDVDAIRERIANLNIDVGGEGGRPDMPINIPTPPAITLPPKEILERGPGPARIPVKPPSIERIMPPMPQVPDVMPSMPQVTPPALSTKKGFFGDLIRKVQEQALERAGQVTPPINQPMPMPMPAPMPSMPAPMPAPMPRLPRVGMAGPGPRMR